MKIGFGPDCLKGSGGDEIFLWLRQNMISSSLVKTKDKDNTTIQSVTSSS